LLESTQQQAEEMKFTGRRNAAEHGRTERYAGEMGQEGTRISGENQVAGSGVKVSSLAATG